MKIKPAQAADWPPKALEAAKTVALHMAYRLDSACERIEIAGSIRRRKPTVGDIEIIAIPKWPPNMFGVREPSDEWDSELDERLDQIIADGYLKPLNHIGRKVGERWSHRKFETYIRGLNLDLFLAEPDNYGMIKLIYTGPKEFGRKIVTPQPHGYLPPGLAVANGFRLYQVPGPRQIETPEEADAFAALGLDFIEPENRR
jgi:DNA polymerase/3'-5' exonuclease PolX